MTITQWLELVDSSWYGSSKGMSTVGFFTEQLEK